MFDRCRRREQTKLTQLEVYDFGDWLDVSTPVKCKVDDDDEEIQILSTWVRRR
jgi:hypothetical protein